MKVLPRTQFGNPILRTPSKVVPTSFIKTKAFRTLIDDMFHTMHRAKGVGLAAPQINKSLRLAVIQVGRQFKRVVINPKIVWHSAKTELDWEGCLSFSPARGHVPRWYAIKVKYMNEKGEWITEKHEGFTARVFQHEIDHLNGMVYVDRMTDMKTLMTHQEFMKRIVK